MNVTQIQRTINQLNSDIASLEKKRAELERKESDKTQKISTLQRSIKKNMSASTLSSKSRQIQGYQNDLVKLSKDKADITKKIADKGKVCAEKTIKLQKEEARERRKSFNEQQNLQRRYEQQIEDLATQLYSQASATGVLPSSHSSFYDDLDTEEYDVFISHAWEDKESFVDEFVLELIKSGVKPWYDKEQITWGDSMRMRIDSGLSKSKLGIVVISPNYIAEGKYWTKTELDGLFQLESVNGKTILPIWHNITKKEVIEYSPTIAGRLAMNTASMTSSEIAAEMVKLFHSTDSVDALKAEEERVPKIT